MFLAGGIAWVKAQSDHQFGILKKAKMSVWLDSVSKGETEGGWWWRQLWGLDHVGRRGPQ